VAETVASGKTAYYGWRVFFEERAKSVSTICIRHLHSTAVLIIVLQGGTLFVSTAAGPVGSFLVQLAKKAGLKVIGATGSDEKVEFLKSIGTDIPINYKTQDLAAILAKEGPIDM
jgi:NADPH-dependent curcumin reductase CurA